MNIFQKIPVKIPRSTNFNLDHVLNTTCNFGDLVPVFCEYLNPGDRFSITPEVVCRMVPMLAPVFDRVNLFFHFFAVPIRLVDYQFQKRFINDNNADGIYTRPFINPSSIIALSDYYARYFQVRSLWDYFGFPTIETAQEAGKLNTDVLTDCFRAYQLIYNEYYRDQNLTSEIPLDPDFNGDELLHTQMETRDYGSYNPIDLLEIRQRCFEKDYFTSALPFTQRGEPVTIPLSGDANIYFDPTSKKTQLWRNGGSSSYGQLLDGFNGASADQDKFSSVGPTSQGTSAFLNLDDDANGISRLAQGFSVLDLNSTHKVDLQGVNASTINELRFAFALQSWLEANARAGNRYKEQLMVHFGVVGKDARLDRPEFLGGVRVPLAISEVLATAQTNQAVGSVDSVSVGDMAGRGYAASVKRCVRRYFADEHCLIIGILSIMPRTSYMQGIRRQFQAFDFFDYPFPKFAHLGEQAIRNRELYLTGDRSYDDAVFGFQSRYSEFKFIPSRVTGDFRSTLRYWHLGRYFSSRPALNTQFVTLTRENQESFNRIFDYTGSDESHFYCHILFRVHARRELPRFGVPTL